MAIKSNSGRIGEQRGFEGSQSECTFKILSRICMVELRKHPAKTSIRMDDAGIVLLLSERSTNCVNVRPLGSGTTYSVLNQIKLATFAVAHGRRWGRCLANKQSAMFFAISYFNSQNINFVRNFS